MGTSHWHYTRQERAAIGAAYDELAYLMDGTGHREPHRLRDALRIERRERSCITAARALIVRGFLEGMRENPPASTLAGYSDGIAAAVMLGAAEGHRRRHDRDGRGWEPLVGVIAKLDAASAAHEEYMRRGIDAARRACST